jgi:hypothetical protein
MTGRAALLLVAVGMPANAGAQEQLVLRHDPVADVTVSRAFQTVTRVSTSDGRAVVTADLGTMRAIAVRGRDGVLLVHLAYDSVRTRSRQPDGNWAEFAIPLADTAWVVGVATGVPGLTLPEAAVPIGRGWETDIALPLAEQQAAGPGEITGRANLTLDSVAVRSNDSVGYLTVNGTFGPATLSIADDAGNRTRLDVTGSMRGSLVWSTGWRAFVSGATTARVRLERTGAQGTERLTLVTTTRHQVRP